MLLITLSSRNYVPSRNSFLEVFPNNLLALVSRGRFFKFLKNPYPFGCEKQGFLAAVEVFLQLIGRFSNSSEIPYPCFSKNRGTFFSKLAFCAQQASKNQLQRLISGFEAVLRGDKFSKLLIYARAAINGLILIGPAITGLFLTGAA
ncbi:MAG: hypothetical protein IJT43_04465 [Stomatobaculum sp.]|nr:hypothetical protein [Stomatobaculum sp.]